MLLSGKQDCAKVESLVKKRKIYIIDLRLRISAEIFFTFARAFDQLIIEIIER